ncbi:three-Cys-motif partner protein TcmP [Sphingomonas sp. LR55]|jgi:three-Cys-motif partner protein
MALDLANYGGREQAYVKHHFLADYLQSLIFKVASGFEEIVYVDGFSGPWKNQGEQFEDTSFGIALRALTLAKQTWATMADPSQRRNVRMTAHLVETNKKAFSKLGALQDMFPDVTIVAHNESFPTIAGHIANQISPKAFSFVLIDPKGWSVDLEALRPLISRNNCEVVFNFMFDFINRFALSDDPVIAAQLDGLIPGRDWRSRIRSIDRETSSHVVGHRISDARKGVLVEEFRAALADVGGYRFVSDIDVLKPTKDRTLYFLVYATRRPKGVEVFRDCHVASLTVQSELRGRRKLEGKANRTGQFELLASTNDMGPDRSSISLVAEEQQAGDLLRTQVPQGGPGVRWDAVWPVVLTRHVIRLKDLKRIANDYRKMDILEFPTWPAGTVRTPKDDFLVRRGSASMVQAALI